MKRTVKLLLQAQIYMKYNLRMAIRMLSKNKLFSFINLFGLTAGFFAAILISQYVKFELGFDKFHTNYQNTYRVSFKRIENNQETLHSATTFLPVGNLLYEEYSEVSDQCRFYYPFTHGVINIDTKSYFEEKPVFADESFFRVFSFELLEGDKERALSEPNAVVLSEDLADKYFGRSNPIGKILKFTFEDGSAELTVKGIMANPRRDSHLKLDMLISFRTLDQWPIFQNNSWSLPFYHTYIQLNPDTDVQAFEASASALLTKYRPNDEGDGLREFFVFQPLKDIHLDSNLQFELGLNGDRQAINFMVLVAILILLIVYLNYINFTTAISATRAKEIGVHRVMGSSRTQLILRFLTESVVLNVCSFFLALLMVVFSLDMISQFTETYFEISKDIGFWLTLLGIVIIGAIFANLYPAIMSSGFQPIKILRGQFSLNTKDGLLRKTLIGAQFAITVAMIGGVVLISEQTNFLLGKDPGFASEQLMVINAPRNMQAANFQLSIEGLGEGITDHSDIYAFTTSGSVPGKVMGSGTIRRAKDETSEGTALQFNLIGYDFFSTYGLKVLEGRAFSRSFQSDNTKVMINEAAVDALGYSDNLQAVGSKILTAGRELEILGVVSNYHHSSLKINFEPIVFVLSPNRLVYMTIQLNTNQLPRTLKVIETEMKQRFPDHPFEYFFLDEVFDREFKTELRYAALLKNFSFLAVILASLGLLGLSTFLISQRSKEIGIRKLLGATPKNFVGLMGSFFLKPMMFGSLIACILLYYYGNEWLATFPFRVGMKWYMFIIPLSIVMAMTVFTLIQLVVKTSRIEPTKMLRDE